MTTLHTCKPVPHLDARLAAAAAYVRPGHIAADIGCDHGKLSAWLAGSGCCPLVFACDLREGPLQKARRAQGGICHALPDIVRHSARRGFVRDLPDAVINYHFIRFV